LRYTLAYLQLSLLPSFTLLFFLDLSFVSGLGSAAFLEEFLLLLNLQLLLVLETLAAWEDICVYYLGNYLGLFGKLFGNIERYYSRARVNSRGTYYMYCEIL
jgi:hypothetical protein